MCVFVYINKHAQVSVYLYMCVNVTVHLCIYVCACIRVCAYVSLWCAKYFWHVFQSAKCKNRSNGPVLLGLEEGWGWVWVSREGMGSDR